MWLLVFFVGIQCVQSHAMSSHVAPSPNFLRRYVYNTRIPFPIDSAPIRGKLTGLACALRIQDFLIRVSDAVFKCTDKVHIEPVLKTARSLLHSVDEGMRGMSGLDGLCDQLVAFAYCHRVSEYPTDETHKTLCAIVGVCKDLSIFRFAERLLRIGELSKHMDSMSHREKWKFFERIYEGTVSNVRIAITDYYAHEDEIKEWQATLDKMLNIKTHMASDWTVDFEPELEDVNSAPRTRNKKKRRAKCVRSKHAKVSCDEDSVELPCDQTEDERVYLSNLPVSDMVWDNLPDEAGPPDDCSPSFTHIPVHALEVFDYQDSSIAQEVLVSELLCVQKMFFDSFLRTYKKYERGDLLPDCLVSSLCYMKERLAVYADCFSEELEDVTLMPLKTMADLIRLFDHEKEAEYIARTGSITGQCTTLCDMICNAWK